MAIVSFFDIIVIMKSFKFAFTGLWYTINSQKNFQIQVIIAAISIVAAYLFEFSQIEWLILIITIALVLAGELVNTVIEVVVDLAVQEKLLPDARLAKDVSAATVLLVSIFALIIGVVLFVPHLR